MRIVPASLLGEEYTEPMNDSDERFSRALVLLVLVLGFVFFLVWDSTDEVRSVRPVLGRTQSEVQENPRGKDKDLEVSPSNKIPKDEDNANK